jgi:tetratricopeptide (TPR) repeat protein
MLSKFGVAGVLLSALFLVALPIEAAGRGGGGGGGGGRGGGGGGGFSGGSFGGGGFGANAGRAPMGGSAWSGNAIRGGNDFRSGSNGAFDGRSGNWDRGSIGHGDFDRRGRGGDWWQFGFWPYWGWGGYGGPYAYGYYGWPGYYGDYGYGDYGYGYGGTGYGGVYSSDSEPYTPALAANDTSMSDYYGQALDAFRQGDFRTAMRLAGHAAVDNPREPKIHVLMFLALASLHDYRGAAMEAHQLAAMGHVPDWATVYNFYGNVQPYTDQLRALEKYVHDHPSAGEARFALGFEYLTTGHKNDAQEEFLAALKATPQDRIAGQLLTQAGGSIPADIAKQQSEHPSNQPGYVPEEARRDTHQPESTGKSLAPGHEPGPTNNMTPQQPLQPAPNNQEKQETQKRDTQNMPEPPATPQPASSTGGQRM